MTDPTNLLLPDDEHYYFGVLLSDSPEEVKERLLRKPDYLYSLTYLDEDSGENVTEWLYMWRGNEGYDMEIGHLSFHEQVARMRARHNLSLSVVLHALTEGEAMNSSTCSYRNPHCYILCEPSSAEGSRTIPRLNVLRATGNTECTRFHITTPTSLFGLFSDAVATPHEPDEVPQEVIDRHCLIYIHRALTAIKAIHDADSMELLLPLRDEYFSYASTLLMRSKDCDEFHTIHKQLGRLEYELMLQPWYAGCRHQRLTHPTGLVICTTCSPGEYRSEVLDFEPGRRLRCTMTDAGLLQLLPAGENDEPMPQRDGGRFHLMPEDSLCGLYHDAQGRIIKSIGMY